MPGSNSFINTATQSQSSNSISQLNNSNNNPQSAPILIHHENSFHQVQREFWLRSEAYLLVAIQKYGIGEDDLGQLCNDKTLSKTTLEFNQVMEIDRTIQQIIINDIKLVKGKEEERMGDGESVNKKLLEIKKRIKKETNKLLIEGTNNMKVKKKRKKKAGEDKGKEDIFLCPPKTQTQICLVQTIRLKKLRAVKTLRP
ncbi:hypothetical protein BY996DRAFT_6441807 [Phakopsora pachyrhizi]|nr:hypothetical protein BY996DRAFT_6441807 [Phakopsora pachyrhizi]